MKKTKTPRAARTRRHIRVRKTLAGTPERPRLAVFRSLNHIYAQVIDDAGQADYRRRQRPRRVSSHST